MTPQQVWGRIERMPDLAFLAWAAATLLRLGVLCAVILAMRWVVWLWATRDRRPINDKIITDLIFGRPTRPKRQPSFHEFWGAWIKGHGDWNRCRRRLAPRHVFRHLEIDGEDCGPWYVMEWSQRKGEPEAEFNKRCERFPGEPPMEEEP